MGGHLDGTQPGGHRRRHEQRRPQRGGAHEQVPADGAQAAETGRVGAQVDVEAAGPTRPMRHRYTPAPTYCATTVVAADAPRPRPSP